MEHKTIVIVEDDAMIGGLLVEKFKADGHTVFLEGDGEIGLAKIQESIPDIVLLDISLPKRDGYDVLSAMQHDPVLKAIPVLIVSNSGEPEEHKRLLALGARDSIIKAALSPSEVLEKVYALLHISGHSSEGEGGSRALSDIHILIVEDDPFLSSITATHLAQEGFTVSVVDSGEKVLAHIAQDTPQLIVLDITMPIMNGIDVLKAIRADERYKDIPVLMFSNRDHVEDIAESKRLGAVGFLVKAQSLPQEMVEKIKELLHARGLF